MAFWAKVNLVNRANSMHLNFPYWTCGWYSICFFMYLYFVQQLMRINSCAVDAKKKNRRIIVAKNKSPWTAPTIHVCSIAFLFSERLLKFVYRNDVESVRSRLMTIQLLILCVFAQMNVAHASSSIDWNNLGT